MKNASSQINRSSATSASMSRRKFLALTGTAAAFTIVPRRVLRGNDQIAPSRKLNIAGIGMGAQGRVDLAEFQKMPEVQIVAVCDVNREGPGYLSWYWGNGKEERLGGREPARREIDAGYAEQKKSGS